MLVWIIILAVFVAGCLGGLVNSVLTGELQLPKRDDEAGVYRPGWLGNVLVGGVAALVFWGLYGPLAGAVLIGGTDDAPTVVFRVSELFGALLTGIGGGRLLSNEIEKRLLSRETEQLGRTKDSLVSAMKELTQEERNATE